MTTVVPFHLIQFSFWCLNLSPDQIIDFVWNLSVTLADISQVSEMFQFFFLPKKFSFSKNIHHMKSPPVSTRLEGCQFWILYWVRPWCVDQAPKLSCSLCCQKWQKQITCCFYHFTELALNLALRKLISWGLAKSLVQNDRTISVSPYLNMAANLPWIFDFF